MKEINIKADFSKLEKLIKLLKTRRYVDVGLLGQKESEEGINIVGIGMVHEFGSISRNILERSFIIMPIETKQKEIAKEAEKNFPMLIGSDKANDIKVVKFLTELGIRCEAVIQEAFDTKGFNTWPDIKQETKDRKDSEAILIDTGTLRKSITSKVGGK